MPSRYHSLKLFDPIAAVRGKQSKKEAQRAKTNKRNRIMSTVQTDNKNNYLDNDQARKVALACLLAL